MTRGTVLWVVSKGPSPRLSPVIPTALLELRKDFFMCLKQVLQSSLLYIQLLHLLKPVEYRFENRRPCCRSSSPRHAPVNAAGPKLALTRAACSAPNAFAQRILLSLSLGSLLSLLYSTTMTTAKASNRTLILLAVYSVGCQ